MCDLVLQTGSSRALRVCSHVEVAGSVIGATNDEWHTVAVVCVCNGVVVECIFVATAKEDRKTGAVISVHSGIEVVRGVVRAPVHNRDTLCAIVSCGQRVVIEGDRVCASAHRIFTSFDIDSVHRRPVSPRVVSNANVWRIAVAVVLSRANIFAGCLRVAVVFLWQALSYNAGSIVPSSRRVVVVRS